MNRSNHSADASARVNASKPSSPAQSAQLPSIARAAKRQEHFTLRDLTALMASSPAYLQVYDRRQRYCVSGDLVGHGKSGARSRSDHMKTPVEGPHAVQNWLDLHDHAQLLRKTVDLSQPHLRRQLRQAVASLFLYEHQLTERARRQARLALWDRDHASIPFPSHPSHLLVWSQCRCPRCQPALYQTYDCRQTPVLTLASA
jgi:hypothetical protein